MNDQKTRTLALLASAALAIGLAGCSSGGATEKTASPDSTEEQVGQTPEPEETSEPEQTVDEACDTLIAELKPAIQKIGEATSTPVAGEIPDFAGVFDGLQQAMEQASSDITNPEVSKPLGEALDKINEVKAVLESVDYSSVDPNAQDALQQAQALNQEALTAAGLSWEDFQGALTSLDEVCPLTEAVTQ
ncbi:MAG: hypothetical protein QM606_02600 [Leucobacter sp.]